MNVRIHIERLCMPGLDEHAARETLAWLREFLAGHDRVIDWTSAQIPVLRIRASGDHPRQLARALADALLRSAS